MDSLDTLEIKLNIVKRVNDLVITYEDAEGRARHGLPLEIRPRDTSFGQIAVEFKRICHDPDQRAFEGLTTLFRNCRSLFGALPTSPAAISAHDSDELLKLRLATLHALRLLIEDRLCHALQRELMHPWYCFLLSKFYEVEINRNIKKRQLTAIFHVYDAAASIHIVLPETDDITHTSFEQWWEAVKNICDARSDNHHAGTSVSPEQIARQPVVVMTQGVMTTEGAAYSVQGERSSVDNKNPLHLGEVLRNAYWFAIGMDTTGSDSDEKTAFVALLKAYCNFAQRQPDAVAQLQVPLTPIYASIALLEQDMWEEREYLKKLFLTERDAIRRDELADSLTGYATDTYRRDPIKARRLTYGIAEQYLNVYSLSRALTLFQTAPHTDLGLRTIVSIYCHPWTIFALIITLISFLIAGSTYIPGITVPTITAIILVMLVILLRFMIRGNTTPIRLLFPRLFGAIAVGMAALVTSDRTLGWKFDSLRLGSIAIAALVYLGAFVYLYLEVETTMKQAPTRPLGPQRRPHATVGQTVLMLYGIGVTESLLMATAVLTLFAPLLVDDPNQITWYPNAVSRWWPLVTLDPSQIVLWAGAALFLGSFLQLMWQDRRVTAVE